MRRAVEADVDQIVDFNGRLATETEGRELDRSRLTQGVLTAIRSPDRACYYVAAAQQGTVGQAMVTYEWSDWRNGVFWWLQSVYVAPDWRQAGVFGSLFAAIRAEAEATPGACGLRLYVEHHNQRAMSVYRSVGMVPGGYELYEIDWSSPPADGATPPILDETPRSGLD